MITTAEFEGSEEVMALAKEFGRGATCVRIPRIEAVGLRSQQSYFFPGLRVLDGVTVTFWRDFHSIRNFIYGPGVRKDWVTR